MASHAICICLAACLAPWMVSASAPSPGSPGPSLFEGADKPTSPAAAPPSQDPFYLVPEGIDKMPPGTLLKHRKPPSPIAIFLEPAESFVKDSHQIHYRTTDQQGNPTATVATVLVPPNADHAKVLSFQVAADSPFGDCAPSFGFQRASSDYPMLYSENTQLQVLLVQSALNRGWVVVVPDADGHKGAWPSVKLASYAVLDGIRAAKGSAPFTGIRDNATIALWGYSWDGVTTLGALALQPSYAPELKIAGAALGGGGSDLNNVASAFNSTLLRNKTSHAGFLPVWLLGLSAQLDNIKEMVDKHLRPEFRQHFYLARHQCLEANGRTFRDEDIEAMFDDPSLLRNVSREFKVPRLDYAVPKVPVFWYQWAHDQGSETVSRAVAEYCSKGATIEYAVETAENLTHSTHGLTAAPGALRWLGGIMDGRVPASGCSNTTVLFQGLDAGFLSIFSKHLRRRIQQFLSKSPALYDRSEISQRV